MNRTKLTTTEKRFLSQLDKKHILLPTKHKKPLVSNWNKFYAEYRTMEKLLELNQEYSLRTGTSVGNYYFIALDLDDLWAKERIKEVRYIQTNKGIHRYFLVRELPKSCWLINSQGEKVGEIHSKGRFVVGIGSIHEKGTRYSLWGRVNWPWKLKLESLRELQEFLKARNIWTTPWGKRGLENRKDLEFYEPKLSKEFRYYQQKEELEAQVRKSKEDLNVCYLCLVAFAKVPEIVREHLQGKRHQRKYGEYLARRNIKI